MINVISYIIHHRTNVANAKIKRLRNFLIQSKERTKTAKNRLYFFKAENQQLLNIFEVKRVKVETEFNDEMMKDRATTTTVKKKNKKKSKRNLRMMRASWRRWRMNSKRRSFWVVWWWRSREITCWTLFQKKLLNH